MSFKWVLKELWTAVIVTLVLTISMGVGGYYFTKGAIRALHASNHELILINRDNVHEATHD